MSFIPYNVYLIILILSGIALIAAPIVFAGEGSTYTLTFFGVLLTLAALLSQNGLIKGLIPNRLVALTAFAISIVVTFSPYLANFTQESSLVLTAVGSSIIILLTTIFTRLTLNEEES